MELIHGSETSANYNLTPGKYPEENIQYSNHGESLKSRVQEIFIHSKTENIHNSSRISLKVMCIQEDSTAHTSYEFSSSVQYLIMAMPCKTEVQNLQRVYMKPISCQLSHHTTTPFYFVIQQDCTFIQSLKISLVHQKNLNTT